MQQTHPASAAERRVFVVLAVVYAAVTAAILPWAEIPGPRTPQIIAVCNGGITLADFCTALVLGHEFRRSGRPALLILICAYVFSAVMAAVQASVFPGALFETPLFGRGQASSWTFLFWRLGTASLYLAAVLYARKPPLPASSSAANRKLLGAVALTLVGCVLLAALAGVLEIPVTVATQFTSVNFLLIGLYLILCGAALFLIWRVRAFGEVLYLWVALVLIASMCDQIVATLAGGQYTLGWHFGKASSVVSACLLLVLWLGRMAAEEPTTRVHALAAYGGAIAVMVGALLLRWFMMPWVGYGVPFGTVFGAVAIAVWIGGWQPAVVAAGLGFLGGNALFTEPLGAFQSNYVAAALGTLMYVGSSALIIGLGGAMRRARDRSRTAEERFRQWQEASIQGFAMLSVIRDDSGKIADFRFEYVNPRGATMTNRTPDALIGLRLLDVLPRAKSSGIFELLAHVAETGEPTDREIQYDSDGMAGWFRNLVVRVGDGVCVSFSDITRTKGLESDLRQRAAELQRADANKSQFLAVLSHELRNPLAPLMNGLTLLGMLRDPKALADTRTMMERQILQLRRLIDDLLDVSRIDRGKLELVKERVAMDSVIRNAVETAQPNIEAKSHQLIVRYAPDPLYVEGDAIRLSQIVANLLNNAAKFTPPRGHIEVSLSGTDTEAVVAVKDTGVGFDPADARRVFDMFVQLNASREAGAGGLGLGLTLVRWLVQMHGGSIQAQSKGTGKGAEFTVRFPRAKAPLSTVAVDVSGPRTYPRRRVLVVDDNEDARETLAQILGLQGFDVRSCRDGMEAFETASQFKPDVAFIDLNMPVMTGTQLAAKLRSEPWGRAIRLVAVTGMGQQSDIESTTAAGFYAHLTKPTSPDEVLRLAGEVDNVLPLPTRKH